MEDKRDDHDSLPLFEQDEARDPYLYPETAAPAPASEAEPAFELAPEPELKVEPESAPEPEPALEPEPAPEPEPVGEPASEPESAPEVDSAPEPDPVVAPVPEPEAEPASEEPEVEELPPVELYRIGAAGAGAAAAAKRTFGYDGIPLSGFGRYLRDVRQRNHLEISDLSEATKIRSTYIESIEDEDYDNLPPAVYVLAYVKTIGGYYELPEEVMGHLTAEIRQRLEYETPEDPSKAIIDEEESVENRIIMRRIILFGSLAVAIFLALILLLTLKLVASKSSAPDRGAAPSATELRPLSEDELLKLHRPPQLELLELPGSSN